MQKYTLELKDYNKLKETFNKAKLHIKYNYEGRLHSIKYGHYTVLQTQKAGYDSNYKLWCDEFIQKNITEYNNQSDEANYHQEVTCNEFIDFICKVHNKCGVYGYDDIVDTNDWDNFYSNYIQHNRCAVEENVMENEYYDFFDITGISWDYEETDDLTVGDFNLTNIIGVNGARSLEDLLNTYELVNVSEGVVSGMDYDEYNEYRHCLCDDIIDMAIAGVDTEGKAVDKHILSELREYLIWTVDCMEEL